MNDCVLVTAVYFSNQQSIMGGRGWDFSYYKPSLYTMSKLDVKKIVVYHDDYQEQSLKQFVQENNLHTFELRKKNLIDLPYYNEIYNLKEKFLHTYQFSTEELYTKNGRLHLICLLKLWFLEQVIKSDQLESTPIAWVDAGLFHHALFPESLGGVELARFDLNNYFPRKVNAKFNSEFGKHLTEWASSGKFMGFGSQVVRLPVEWNDSIADTTVLASLIGGLFSGTPTVIKHISSMFYEFLDILIHRNILALEEGILSKLFTENQELFDISTFDTWYHDIPTDPCYTEGVFVNDLRSFYKTFFEFVETKQSRQVENVILLSVSPEAQSMPVNYEKYDLPNIAIYGSHNASFAVEYNGTILEVLEAERFLNVKNAGYAQYYVASSRRVLGKLVGDYFKEKYGFTEYGYVLHQHCETIEEADQKVFYWKDFPAKHHIECRHHESHAAGCFYQSPYEKAIVVSFDGGGNDGYFKIYLAIRGEPLRLLVDHPIDLGFPYMILGEYLGDIKKENALNLANLVYAGKILGLQSYGNPNTAWKPIFKDMYKARLSGTTYPEYIQYISQQLEIPLSDVQRITGSTAYDIAATSQAAFEEIFFELVDDTLNKYSDLPICLAGGCALNIVLNTKVKQKYNRPVFVGPNPNDCGLAVGMLANLIKPINPIDITYSGPELLDKYRFPEFVEKYLGQQINVSTLAGIIYQGKIIGLVQGRSEHGPRALGNRSILCSPLLSDMKDTLNLKVKHREWYRPFAPVVRLEDVSEYFEWDGESRWMSFCPVVKEKYRNIIPAVVHVDNTARIQTVTEEQNPLLYQLLTEFKQLTGIGVLLNTSFNVDGKPILSTLHDAFKVFETTELDGLYINGFLFDKKMGRYA